MRRRRRAPAGSEGAMSGELRQGVRLTDLVMLGAGTAIGARVQTALMLMLLVVLGGLVAASGPHLRPQLFADALAGGWLPIASALPLMIQLFLGIETATEVGGEVADARRVVPLGV